MNTKYKHIITNYQIIFFITYVTFFTAFADTPASDHEDEMWDEEDLLPLLPPGTGLKDYAEWDDNLATGNTLGDDWEEELMNSAKKTEEGDKSDSESEKENDEPVEKVISLNTAWEYSKDIMDFALSTNNQELLNTQIKTQNILKLEKQKATEKMKQSKLDTFFRPTCRPTQDSMVL